MSQIPRRPRKNHLKAVPPPADFAKAQIARRAELLAAEQQTRSQRDQAQSAAEQLSDRLKVIAGARAENAAILRALYPDGVPGDAPAQPPAPAPAAKPEPPKAAEPEPPAEA